MTELSQEKLELYKQTSLGWQSENLKIVTKQSNLVNLDHNIAQIKVHNAMALQRKYGYPVMLLIYKARQEGISTYIEACMFEMCNRNENWHACLVSVDNDSTAKVFRMCDTYQAEMPKDIKRRTVRASAKEIRYDAPHRSSILCQTAGKQILGRGGTSKGVHATEVTFWAHAERQVGGLLQEVPDEPDTMTVMETTANGTGNYFSKEYWAAVKRMRNYCTLNPEYAQLKDKHSKEVAVFRADGSPVPKFLYDHTVLRGYLPIFLSWQDFPDYRVELPKGHKEVPGMTPEMHEYIEEGLAMNPPVTLDKEQIYFALLKIQNKCGGDYDIFKQEYPRTARESERATGRMVFKPMDIDLMEKFVKPPAECSELYMSDPEDKSKIKRRQVNRNFDCWSIWKLPESDHSYCLFGDVAEGVLADKTDKKSSADRSVAGVLDRNTFEVVAVYYGRPDTIEYGDQMLYCAKLYNYAWATPEMNSIGQSVLDTFKRDEYEYIYQREHHEDQDNREDSKLLGWKTTVKTRKPMIADLSTVVKEGELTVYDIRCLEEMRMFGENAVGKPEAKTGEHDDCVIMLSGLVQLHQRCPMNENLEEEAKSTDNTVDKSLVAGAVDDMSDMDDFDDGDGMYEDMSDYE